MSARVRPPSADFADAAHYLPQSSDFLRDCLPNLSSDLYTMPNKQTGRRKLLPEEAFLDSPCSPTLAFMGLTFL